MYNSEPGNSADRPFRKRKRKSGFFSKAKKFGKQGKLGRGYEIDSETYSYFLNVLELCQKNEFENDEDKSKSLFVFVWYFVSTLYINVN